MLHVPGAGLWEGFLNIPHTHETESQRLSPLHPPWLPCSNHLTVILAPEKNLPSSDKLSFFDDLMPVQDLRSYKDLMPVFCTFKKSSHYTWSATSSSFLPQIIKLLQYRWLQICFLHSFLTSSANKHSKNELACQLRLTGAGKRHSFFLLMNKGDSGFDQQANRGKKHLLVCCNGEFLCLHLLGEERHGKTFSRAQA